MKINRLLVDLFSGLLIVLCAILVSAFSSLEIRTLVIGNGDSFLDKLLSIQSFMWFSLGFGLGDLYLRYRSVKAKLSSLKMGYLPDTPEQEKRVLTSDDMPDIYRSVKEVSSDLAELIRSLSLRFQAGKSVEQTHELLSSQLELWQYRVDLDYNLLKYITWLIPTVGFIGTVVGISEALSFAGSGEINPESEAFYLLLRRS